LPILCSKSQKISENVEKRPFLFGVEKAGCVFVATNTAYSPFGSTFTPKKK